MFLIPSNQLPTIFDPETVNSDFLSICKRASILLNIESDSLYNALKKSAEEEEKIKVKFNDNSNKRKKYSCCVTGCIMEYINTPHYIDENIYCKEHYKQLISSDTIEDIINKNKETDYDHNQKYKHSYNNNIYDFSNPVNINDKSDFWKFRNITLLNNNIQYRYYIHFYTNLIINIKDESEFILIGRIENNDILYKEELSDEIIDWCINSGINVNC
jgi:hypothetical protein